ncbi:hypothetical protein N657DRAFT_646771 [Parathielavia appendiculata]|uniref:Secreted protein n=1 Tax=Parathielavia appendiculata TaxID=2587402 RepID=A0AAN6TWN4_9PEZI|nr:hypothetical protein N657DRAFT_646771 [Parathielavia appendiculata]
MQLPKLVALALLAATTAADYVDVTTICNSWGGGCSSYGIWHTAYGRFDVDFNEGCRDPDVPSLNWMCIDWPNQRAHFNFDGQPKRCLVKMTEEYQPTIRLSRWDEVGCYW